jgi:hypothetical protein
LGIEVGHDIFLESKLILRRERVPTQGGRGAEKKTFTAEGAKRVRYREYTRDDRRE